MKLDPLDKIFSRYIRLKSGGYCQKCKRYFGIEGLQCAHFNGRLRHTTRWDERNVAALCGECHYEIDNHDTAKASLRHELFSPEVIEEVDKLSYKTIKDHPIDKGALMKYFKTKVKEME